MPATTSRTGVDSRENAMVRKPGLITLLVLAAGAALPAASASATDVVEYYHLDAVGNVLAVTNSLGAVVEQHDYLPFGEEWCVNQVCGSVTPGQPRRFTGKERDAETGLDYFGARYYGSRIGRFTTVDPAYTIKENLVDPQRWNKYAYGRNNPLRFVDPDGRDILVVENGPTRGNPMGHTAIAISGQGIYSFGNYTAPGSSPTEYLLRMAPDRDTTIFYLKTSQEQDEAALKYLQSFGGTDINPSDNVENPRVKRALEIAYAACGENCSTRVNAALDAAGVPSSMT